MNQAVLASDKEQINLTATAVVLEVPFPVSQRIQELRERFDPVLARSVPVEITIAGSSGLATLAPGQDSGAVLAALQQIAAVIPPFTAAFGRAFRFPRSTVYALTVKPLRPFRELHQRLKTAPIKFLPSPFHFMPHCSLHIWGELPETLAQEILQTRIPERFTIRNMALYQRVSDTAVALVTRFPLTGTIIPTNS